MTAIDLRYVHRLRTGKDSSRRGEPLPGSAASRAVVRAALLVDAVAAGLVLAFGSGLTETAEVGVLLLVLCWLIGLVLRDAYDWRTLLLRPVGLRDLVTLAGWLTLILGLVAVVRPTPITGYVQVIVLLVAAFWAGRACLRGWLRSRLAAGHYRIKALVRSADADARALAEAFAADPALPFDVVATRSDTRRAGDSLAAVEADLLATAAAQGADTVLLVGPQPENAMDLRRLVWFLQTAGLQVAVVQVAATMTAPRVGEVGRTGIPIVTYDDRHRSLESSVRKVLVDRTLALAGLVLLSPVFAVLALAIRWDSPGPVFFHQTRVGQAGRRFTLFKFRTMADGAEELQDVLADLNVHEGGTLFKIPDDPRMTRMGVFLRSFSLDELPQIYNVLRGEMSLVGPRPPLPCEVANYPGDAYRRFLVRPGLTGLWQVSGRSNLDPEESARIDAHYVEHWSPSLDAWILAKTIKVVISGDGAY